MTGGKGWRGETGRDKGDWKGGGNENDKRNLAGRRRKRREKHTSYFTQVLCKYTCTYT